MLAPVRSSDAPSRRRGRSRAPVLAGLATLVLICLTLLSQRPVAVAQTELKVMVTIHKVWERGCYGEDTFLGCVGGEDADFYPEVYLDGQKFDKPVIEDETSIAPEWQFTRVVAPDGLVPVRIEMWDEDSGARGGDDHVDLTAGNGNNLDLTVIVGKDPGACRITGNVPNGRANCGQRLSDGGHNDEESAGIEYTVDVVYPTRVGRTAVVCTHSPLWPQPGQAVTIQAVAMDIQTGTTAGGLGFPVSYTFNPITADKIQIWWNANSATQNRARAQECLKPAAAAGCQTTVSPTGASFQYGCWVENPGVTVASNFREVSVGAPMGVNVVPVLFHQPRERAIDVVLHPDQNYANGWTDVQFLQDASTIVNGALAEPTWTQYMSRVNLWVSARTGNPTWPAVGNGSTPNSTIALADGGGREAFADASGIVHRRTITDAAGAVAATRDAAGGGLFTVNVIAGGPANIMRHEMGHAVFGLADEYCCDGGYFQQPDKPNVYNSAANCNNDFGDLNTLNGELKWPNQGPCRAIPQVTVDPATATATPGPSPTPMFWVSDTTAFQSGATTLQDLMVGNDYGLTNDIRRFRWVFNQLCPDGGC